MALQPGATLGPYEIQSPLGAGGMGEVYRARDTRLERTVAIKILPTHLSSSAELKARFEREARAASSLNHPHICHLYDIGSQDGTSYLVMEYLEGESLADRLQKGALPVRQTLQIGVEIAQALTVAHRAGILHRDLKPANVMLTAGGAKLLDFGLAKRCHELKGSPTGVVDSLSPTASMTIAELSSPARALTQQGTVVGTFQYMAPEVLQGAEADARSDIFSFDFSCLMSGAIVTGFYLWQRNFHRLNLCPPSHRLRGNLDQSAGDTASLRVPLVELSRKRPDLCRVAGNGAVLPEFFEFA
jgi:serine/threonine protein kinase